MNAFRKHLCFFFSLALLCYMGSVRADVVIDPLGIAVSIEGNDEFEVEITLTNDGDLPVSFEIDMDEPEVEDEEQRNGGPRRDDLGDILDRFQMQHFDQGTRGGSWAKDWDTGLMWWSCYEGWVNVIDGENDYELLRSFQPGGNCGDIAILNGIVYVTIYNTNQCNRFDTAGDRLDGINFDWVSRGIAADPELEVLMVLQDGGQYSIHVYEVDEDEIGDEIGVIDNHLQYQNEQNQAAWQFCWAPAHEEGEMWSQKPSNMADLNIKQIDIDTEEWQAVELAQAFRGPDASTNWLDGIGHDGFNLWVGTNSTNEVKVLDDDIEESYIKWVNPNIEEGVIGADDSEVITLSFLPLEAEGNGVYEMLLTFELTEVEEEGDHITEEMIMSVIMSLNSPTADIFGTITDAATGEIVEGVEIDIDPFQMIRLSDVEGNYNFANLPLGAYEFTFTAPDYLPFTDGVETDAPEDFEFNVALLHSECNPDPDEIITELAPDTDTQRSLEISNDGNGPLSYTVERRLLGDANADPWTLRLSHMFGQDRDDSRIQGVVFADDRFYVAGAHDNEPAIYIFSREGEYIDLFIQPGEDRYGMKDLAWDGRLIWGAIGQTIYGMTLEGDVEVEFEGPFRPTSNLTWDPEHDLLWVSATTSDIAGLDRNGNLVSELDRQGLRMYGFGYWPDDPDDSPLYIFDRVRDVGDLVVHKMNLDNGELTEVSILEHEGGGSAAGAFITNKYDIYSWVFMAVANAGADDRVDIWQIDARKEWFLLDPAEGVIEADNTQEFDLTLDATGLPPEVFEGELVFLHDGVGSETHIPVTLRVVEGPVEAERTIQLDIGWNMVSVNLQPDPDDIRVLMRELVEADLLLLMKDGQGRFYSPEFDFCNIPGWNVADGYQMKMDDAGEVTLAGITVMGDDAIPLVDGWNLISYYPRTPVDAIVAFSGIVDQLLMAKDGWGRFYNPEWGFSNMGDLQELRGYQVKVTEDMELVYRLQAEDDEFVLNVCDRQGKLPVHTLTGNNMSLLVKGGAILGGEIGVYANGEFVGSGVLEDGICGIAVWGDDPTTSAIDGALEGTSLELSVFDENGSHPVQYKTLAGDGLYQIDGFLVVELIGAESLPLEFGIASAYPNPFNSRTLVSYGLPEAGLATISLYDLEGRLVKELVRAHKPVGSHSIVIDGSTLSSGVYIVQLRSGGDVSRWKVAMVK